MILTTKDSYEYYCNNTENPLKYAIYYKICNNLNGKMFDYLQEGKGNRIEFIPYFGQMQYFKFKKRVSNNKGKIICQIDWQKTNALWKEEPETRLKSFVYFTNNWYIGVKWLKGPNKKICKYTRYYKFTSSRTNGVKCKTGNKNKLLSLLRENDMFYLNFPDYDIQSNILKGNIK